jgi:hypothetical protein
MVQTFRRRYLLHNKKVGAPINEGVSCWATYEVKETGVIRRTVRIVIRVIVIPFVVDKKFGSRTRARIIGGYELNPVDVCRIIPDSVIS